MGAREQHVVVLFCFDHIKAKSARKTLVELVQEFRVTGMLRRGEPGKLPCAKSFLTLVRTYVRLILTSIF